MQPAHEFENGNLIGFQAIVEQAPDAIIFADRDGIIRVWNRGAGIVFGYSAAEVLGASLDVIIPEQLRSAHWEGFRRAVDTSQTKYAGRVLTTRSVHKDGSKLYVDLSFGLVRDRDGAVAGALAIGRDCTARYSSDRALRAHVLELEKKLEAASKGSGATAIAS
jgi:PAS domain S-box-containing protein